MSLQPSTTSFATQPYLHFPSLKSNSDGRSSIHSLEKTHLSKNDVIRLVMDKDKPVFPVKAKFETGRPQGVVPPPPPPPPPPSTATILKRKRESIDERGVEEEVARNVSKILSATRAAQNGFPPPIMKSSLTTSLNSSWNNLKSNPKINYCDTCSKSFPSPKSLRSHSCIRPTEEISSPSTLNATLNLSQILQTPPISLDLNRFDSTEIPSNLITPDVSSYESSPPSESASMDDWNSTSSDGKIEEKGDKEDQSSLSQPSKAENKWCPDCGKILCSTSNLKRHRATCKYTTDIKEECTNSNDAPLPKWAENKSQSWLQLSVGEHLKAKHLGLTLSLRNEVKEEKGIIGVTPSVTSTVSSTTPSPTTIINPIVVKEEIIQTTPSIIRDEKESKIDSRASYECTVCLKTFSCRKNVRRHMVAVHKVIPPHGASLSATPRPINEHSNRLTVSRSSEESIDGDEEGNREIKMEEIGEELNNTFPKQQEGTNSVANMKVKTENGDGMEKDRIIGEKRKIMKTDVEVEKEIPLDFTLQSANKKMRLDAIREEDGAIINARSVKMIVSRIGAMRASPLLASLLSNTREITLDVSSSALQSMLMVYSDNSKLSHENVSEVAEIALKLKVNQVKNLCEKFIVAEVPKLDLMKAIRLADMYKLSKLKDDLFSSLNIEVLRSMAMNDDYKVMRPELKAELLDKFGEFL